MALVDLWTVTTVVVDGRADDGAADDRQSQHEGEGRQPNAGAHETTS